MSEATTGTTTSSLWFYLSVWIAASVLTLAERVTIGFFYGIGAAIAFAVVHQ